MATITPELKGVKGFTSLKSEPYYDNLNIEVRQEGKRFTYFLPFER